jgi:hypothetical protein
MQKLNRKDLWVLEDYADARATFQPRVLAHRLERELRLGPCLKLIFHDRLTIQYEIQEALFHARLFEREGVQRELAARNRLIPDGDNWKATLLADIDDPSAEARGCRELEGIERQTWVQVEGEPRVMAASDGVLTGSRLCFALSRTMRLALMAGAYLNVGVEHPRYRYQLEVPETTRLALMRDLDPL